MATEKTTEKATGEDNGEGNGRRQRRRQREKTTEKAVMPWELFDKGMKLTGGQMLKTTTHEFRKSPRLLELLQEDVTEEDGSIKLSFDDIEDIRNNTQRGQQLLELISRREPRKTATTQTTNSQIRNVLELGRDP